MEIAEKLKARFARDERRKANMRLVYGYRHIESMEMSDNLIVLPYNQFDVNRRYLEHVISEMPVDLANRMDGYEIVRLGVWYKDKNKFDFLRAPYFEFRISDFVKKEGEK